MLYPVLRLSAVRLLGIVYFSPPLNTRYINWFGLRVRLQIFDPQRKKAQKFILKGLIQTPPLGLADIVRYEPFFFPPVSRYRERKTSIKIMKKSQYMFYKNDVHEF